MECAFTRSLPVRSISLGLPNVSDDRVEDGLRTFAIADDYDFAKSTNSIDKRPVIVLWHKKMWVIALPVGPTASRVSLFATGTARTDQAAIDATFRDIEASMRGIPGAVIEELSYPDPSP
jgi:hypothetical protein